MTELDHAVVIIGLPKYGKSTIAREEVERHLETYPNGLALCHDTHEMFVPDLCKAYTSTADWRAERAKWAPNAPPPPRGASFRCSSTEVVKLARELGERCNTMKNVRVPIIVVIDESSLMDSGSGSTWMSPDDVQLLSNRRHWGIAPVYNMQRPAALTEAFLTQATDVYLLSIPTEKNAAALEEKLGLQPGDLQPLVRAPKFQYLHWRQGEGLVDA